MPKRRTVGPAEWRGRTAYQIAVALQVASPGNDFRGCSKSDLRRAWTKMSDGQKATARRWLSTMD